MKQWDEPESSKAEIFIGFCSVCRREIFTKKEEEEVEEDLEEVVEEEEE